MRTMPSAEFRKTYAKLAEPTTVTVNGHLIGVWTPHKFSDVLDQAISETEEVLAKELGLAPNLRVEFDRRPFNSRPFTPVPKVRGR